MTGKKAVEEGNRYGEGKKYGEWFKLPKPKILGYVTG